MDTKELYEQLRKRLAGQDVAELMIEARRDARELANAAHSPYRPGTFEHSVFIDEIAKMRKEENGI